MAARVTVTYNEFVKVKQGPGVHKTDVFGDISAVAPFGDFIAITQENAAGQASILIPAMRVHTVHIQDIPNVEAPPEATKPAIYVPDLRVVSDTDVSPGSQ